VEEDEEEVDLSAGKRGVNCEIGKTNVVGEELRFDEVEVVDCGAISGPSRASA